MLGESANTVHPSPIPTSSVEILDVEHAVVIEGFCGKVKGLEQTIVTDRNAVKSLRDMVVGLSEHVDSSLSTAVTSQPASGPVLGDRLNLIREQDVVRKGIERSEKLILQLISTRFPVIMLI